MVIGDKVDAWVESTQLRAKPCCVLSGTDSHPYVPTSTLQYLSRVYPWTNRPAQNEHNPGKRPHGGLGPTASPHRHAPPKTLRCTPRALPPARYALRLCSHLASACAA